jgi:hypothetical protein
MCTGEHLATLFSSQKEEKGRKKPTVDESTPRHIVRVAAALARRGSSSCAKQTTTVISGLAPLPPTTKTKANED